MISLQSSKHHLKQISPLFFPKETVGRLLLFVLLVLTIFSSCTTDEAEDVNDINKQTILVFMPWTGSQTSRGLYDYFVQNLDSIESAIKSKSTMSGRVLVFLSTSADESSLYEITYENKEITHTTLKTYTGNLYTTSDGITQILNDVQSNAFALNYAMIIGCHGSGWTYKEDWEQYPYRSKFNPFSYTENMSMAKPSIASTNSTVNYPATRFYGSVNDNDYATNIPVLAEGIKNAGIKMQYILFDDCYMANVETAYELKDATCYLIGSTSEVMAQGMPYQTMWASLATATPAYASAVNAFNTFYTNYDTQSPLGKLSTSTLSAIDCRKLDRLAEQMRMINQNYTFADSLVDSLQILDGFNIPIFYDLGDYVSHLCKNTDILNDFNATLTQVIKSTAHNDSIYSILYNYPKFVRLKHSSGLTISDPSKNSVALKGREKTAWWKATH